MTNRQSQDGQPSDVPMANLSRQTSRQSSDSRTPDTYSLVDVDVADGFRPNDSVDASSANLVQPTNNTSSGDHLAASASGMRNRPSSISKPAPHDSLTLQHEHPSGFAGSSSSSQSNPLAGAPQPTTGPLQPSFPYHLYDQNTRPYEQSATTPSSPISPSSPSLLTGPSHPYGLYAQSTSAVDATPSPSIPFGPDGEDPGGLGQMSNVEVPPPYTRYPEVAYVAKEATPNTEAISGAASPSSPISAPVMAGAGGLGVATRNPEFSSTEEDLGNARSAAAVQRQSSQASSHEVNVAAHGLDEKNTQSEWKRKVRKRAKQKMCGIIPYWAICLTVLVVVILGALLGALLGTLLTQDEETEDRETNGSKTDADSKPPIGEIQPYDKPPKELEGISTGLFGLPPLEINAAPKLCFNESSDAQAWSCNIPYRYYSIDITRIKNATSVANYDLELLAFNETDAQFIWGTQPPNVPKPIVLQLVNDTFDDGRGPAWWLKMQYNKTVIVREDVFKWEDKVNGTKSKRAWDYDDYDRSDFDPSRLRKTTKGAMPGDKPWICTWPNTTLEIFIYPNANASLQDPPTNSADNDYDQPTPVYDEDGNYLTSKGDQRDSYPKVVKFLERRLKGEDTKATCRQVRIIKEGTDTEDIIDDDGNKVEFEVQERSVDDDELQGGNSKRSLHARDFGTSLAKRGPAQELSPCSCYWLST